MAKASAARSAFFDVSLPSTGTETRLNIGALILFNGFLTQCSNGSAKAARTVKSSGLLDYGLLPRIVRVSQLDGSALSIRSSQALSLQLRPCPGPSLILNAARPRTSLIAILPMTNLNPGVASSRHRSAQRRCATVA